ncbi:MAG: lytic transglycosylase domain-containing protein [Saprospiraceae bacterium]
MMKRRILLSIIMAVFSAGLLSILFLSNKATSKSTIDPIFQKIKGIRMVNNLEFANENIPIHLPDVAERLERELLVSVYHHSSTLIQLKLANRFLPIVDKIFKEEGLPKDLKYIAVAESSLRNAISPAGAKGIWQFRDATATELGLVINDYVDERNHFEKSTRAAAKYLKNLFLKFNSWSLVCAAYNMGPTALTSAMKEQEEQNYFDLNLNEETNRYLFRLIAIKAVMEDPETFGYFLDKEDYYPDLIDYTTITVDSSITSLSNFAHLSGISYRELKIYNPWLMKSSLINKSKVTFEIRIPNK